MNILSELKSRFRSALAGLVEDPTEALELIRPAQDARFGDYQANCAMPLGKLLRKPPREVAEAIVAKLDVSDFCHAPEIAGPGFINLKLRDEWLTARLSEAVNDERLGIAPIQTPRTIVIDYSSPNVAKPMHVGHIRSTVIGDALCRTLRFLGHRVISDNHLGDWGTQFGMILYGYKHFLDAAAFQANPVAELGRLYKFVNRLVDYHEGRQSLPELEQRVAQREAVLAAQRAAPNPVDKAAEKKAAQAKKKLESQLAEALKELAELKQKLAVVEADPQLADLRQRSGEIAQAVLAETAKLHEGDVENRRLWNEVLPYCRDEIQRIYARVGVQFDHEHGESFYQDMLADVVADLEQRGLSQQSEGATCVFLDGFETPMIIRKRDGAFLYSTTDLATIAYRVKTWQPDCVLYVVDFRQGEHFKKLFAAARLWGYRDLDLRHISFGTVMGEDGKPFKTRASDTVGLEGLLDEAERRAHTIVCQNDDEKPGGRELTDEERLHISRIVGIGALKYADLAQNRETDYVFSYDKMLATVGNTATYMQYSYARVQSIFRKGDVSIADLRRSGLPISLAEPAERSLALAVLRFSEALQDMLVDYRPNLLTAYLFDLAQTYFTFYEKCPVLKAETAELRTSRFLLCDLTARTIKQGLALLGIGVVDKM